MSDNTFRGLHAAFRIKGMGMGVNGSAAIQKSPTARMEVQIISLGLVTIFGEDDGSPFTAP